MLLASWRLDYDSELRVMFLSESCQLVEVCLVMYSVIELSQDSDMSVCLSVTADKRMIEALEAASYDRRAWKGWSCNIAELLLKLLAKRAI